MNFIRTSNPYSLETPPDFFLAALAAYDDQLVVFPSTEDACYQLCRRLNHRGVLQPLLKHPDTAIMAQHKLIGVRRILPPLIAGGNVWMQVLAELPDFDQWRFSSADAACDQLDALEAAQEQAVERQIADGLDALGGDAYRLTKTRLGERISMRSVGRRDGCGKVGAMNFKRGGSSIVLPGMAGWSG